MKTFRYEYLWTKDNETKLAGGEEWGENLEQVYEDMIRCLETDQDFTFEITKLVEI